MTNQALHLIHLHPVTLKAFGKSQGHWTNYEAVARDKITSLTVKGVLINQFLEYRLDSFALNFSFDYDDLPVEKYGIVYGDEQFEEEAQTHLSRLLPARDFGLPAYTESGEQLDGLISMEYNFANGRRIANMSAHQVMELMASPLVQEISFC